MRNLITMLGSFLLLILLSCNSRPASDLLRPDWKGIDTSKIDFKMGDCIFISDSNKYYAALLLDIDLDSAGYWYGLCFTNYCDSIKPDINLLKSYLLFGRQIPTGLINTKCIDCYDLAYLNESANRKVPNKIGLIGHLKYDYNKIHIGSISPSYDISGLIGFYSFGIDQRKKVPDDCQKSIFKLDAIRERYFPIGMIK
jgi:hypothetical protein